jgi:hypothetical protein
MDDKRLTPITVRLPGDIAAYLFKTPPGERGKKNSGRSGEIVRMLRWAISEREKQAEAGSRPAEAKA